MMEGTKISNYIGFFSSSRDHSNHLNQAWDENCSDPSFCFSKMHYFRLSYAFLSSPDPTKFLSFWQHFDQRQRLFQDKEIWNTMDWDLINFPLIQFIISSNQAYPYLEASNLARSSETTLSSHLSTLFPQITTSGSSQYACVLSWSSQPRMLRKDCSLVTSKMRINPMASRKKAVVKLRNLEK